MAADDVAGEGEEQPRKRHKETAAVAAQQEIFAHGYLWPSLVRCVEQLDAMRDLACREDDVFVASYPKCGTHWVHRLCCLILLPDPDAEFKTEFNLALEFNAWEKGNGWELYGGRRFDDLPGPRILATHCPLHLLPREAEPRNCRIVYCVREVKDALVSYFHFSNSPLTKAPGFVMPPPDLDGFVERFCHGATTDPRDCTDFRLGGLGAHVREYAAGKEAGRRIHVVCYDRLQSRPEEEVRRLARFLGKSDNEEELKAVLQSASFDSMRADALAMEAAKGKGKGKKGEDGRGSFTDVMFRKGKCGGWSDTLSSEQAAKVDAAFAPVLAPVAHLY